MKHHFFAIIFSIMWIKLIERKSDTASAPFFFFGKSAMFAVLSQRKFSVEAWRIDDSPS
jgi:hypothetical protein